jgi:hypothetical protein
MNYADPEPKPAIDPALYERLIAEGIADADRRGAAVDHVTARRLATWLASRSQQQPDLASALVRFTRTGAVSQAMKNQLRRHAYSPSYPHRSEAFRLVQYSNSRGKELGPVTGFARDCDQIDQADAMLAGLRDRVKNGAGPPVQAFPDTEGPPVIARAERDRRSRTVSLILDETTANIAMYAIAAHAGDCEAHVREVRQFAHGLPEQSYGKRNRQAIAARETRVAQRLRAVERAYHVAAEHDTTITPPAAAARAADREMELE